MSNYKVSVIIPVYNGEKNIDQLINSFKNQTIGFENIEIIFHDDASKDKSYEIIKGYAQKYDNIKLISSKTNVGSGEGRNKGIKQVTAPYMTFVDVDDNFTSTYVETLFNSIDSNNADIVQCQIINKTGNEFYINDYIESINADEKIVENIEDKLLLRGTMWGNIFKTSFIHENNIKCPNTGHEDGVFFTNAIIKSNKIIVLENYYGYIYIFNEDSTVHNITSTKPLFRYIAGFKELNKLFEENNINKNQVFNNSLSMVLFMFIKFKGSKKDKIKFLKYYSSFLKSLNYPIKLGNIALNILNSSILSEKYDKAIFLSNVAGLFYNNNKIRNFIFKKYCGLKKIDSIE